MLRESREANTILLTEGKNFGELVFYQRLVHSGVELFGFFVWPQKLRLTLSLTFLLTARRNYVAPSQCCPLER